MDRPLKSLTVAFASIVVVMAASALVHAQKADDPVMRDMAASTPPSWIKWLGWATDGTRIAWRQGPHGTGNVPGKPIWIARLNSAGAIVDRHFRRTQVQKALDTRGIRRRPQALIEEVTPLDVLIRTRAGEVIAVAVRGSPPVLAVLRKSGEDYSVVARQPVMGPVEKLRVNAAEQPAGRLLAIVAHTGRGQRRQGSLMIVPLQPGAKSAVALPRSSSPSTATPKKAGQ